MQGCNVYKNVPYFKDVSDSARLSVQTARYHVLHIEPGDILTVGIQTLDPEANAVFNQSPSTALSQLSASVPQGAASGLLGSAVSTTPSTQSGYLVSSDGFIQVPFIGKIYVGGLTTEVASDTIYQRVVLLYKTPTVSVRFANLKVNVLGEVNRPGTYILTNERNTILDALAQAGDLTIFGKRENVLLIRDSAGISNFIRFSLNTKDIVQKDYYFLRQNDVIYVEPTRGKAANLDAAKARNYAIAASIISIIIVIATRVN
jgi:polysaccharide biosynthesis/export protein